MTRYGYERVSTNDQHPEAQGNKLRAYGVDRVFTDKGVSGSQARRPAWDKLLRLLVPGDELVCVRLDRIGRSVANLVEVIARLQAAEVELIVLDQNIDTRTPAGKLLFHMLAAIAEFERDLIIERTRDGQAVVREAGSLRRSLGGPPVLGFRLGDEPEDEWQVDPAAAEWLREAADRVLAGEPVEKVHAALPVIYDATGREVNAKMLRAALQRPASAGLIDGKPAAIEGPLDVPTFTRLAVLFGSRKTGRPAEEGRYPFGKVLHCGKCGNQLTGLPGYKARGYYSCRNPHKSLGVLHPCRGCSVPAQDVHDLIRDAIMDWAQTPAARLAAASTPETADRRAELETRIAEVQAMTADLWSKRLRNGISPAKYAELDAEATVQLDTAAAELAELDAIDAQPGVPVVIDWDAMTTAEQLRTLAEAYVTPLVVQPGNGGGAARSAADRIDLVPVSR